MPWPIDSEVWRTRPNTTFNALRATIRHRSAWTRSGEPHPDSCAPAELKPRNEGILN
jgi:hypothetical protein